MLAESTMALSSTDLAGLPKAGDPTAIFNKIGTDYELAPSVTQALITIGFASIEEFGVALSEPSALSKVLDIAQLKDAEAIKNSGRLKLAVQDAVKAWKAKDLAKSKPPSAIDELLPDDVLDDMAERF